MAYLRARLVALRYLLATAWPIVLITTIGLVVAYQFVAPEPPDRLILTTGNESGAYHAYAQRYASLLAAKGIGLDIRTSPGSLENLRRVASGEADVGFAQAGSSAPPSEESAPTPLRSLGSVSYEPVWVFYRGDRTIDKLYQLSGMRVAVGEEGSGIRGLALQLLEANDIKPDDPNLLPLAGLNAAEALQQSQIDAAFIVAAQEAPVVQVLLRSPGVRVLSFSQVEAYLRRFPFLSRIVLPRGVVDLVRDLPPGDTVLLATTANVVVRDDLHPALAALLLQAMTEVNGQGGFFQRAGEFPSAKEQTLPLADEAKRYYQSGPPFLQRYLPFWLAVLAERLVVMILPLVMLLLPLLKFAPSLYSWRVRSKIFRCYGDLKFLENDLRQHFDASRFQEYVDRLDHIEEDASTRHVPLAFTDQLYTLREHINLVRAKLSSLPASMSRLAPSHDKEK